MNLTGFLVLMALQIYTFWICYTLEMKIQAIERRNQRMRHIDLNKLTAEEGQNLLRELIELLSEDDFMEVLNSELTAEQKGELAVAWGNE